MVKLGSSPIATRVLDRVSIYLSGNAPTGRLQSQGTSSGDTKMGHHMIDATDLVAALSPRLQALEIDASIFQKAGDFAIFDAYPQHLGTTYRLRLEVDVRDGTVSPVETYARVYASGENHEDVECDQAATPAPIYQKGVEFFDTVKTGIAEFLPSGPKL